MIVVRQTHVEIRSARTAKSFHSIWDVERDCGVDDQGLAELITKSVLIELSSAALFTVSR